MVVVDIINFLNSYYILPQDFLITYFTILGILVTLISISSSLTKEIRQDLILKHYLKNGFVKGYIGFVSLSFIAVSIIYYLNVKYLNLIVFVLFIILFIYTLVFSILFILNLNRSWFYKIIIKSFRKEINSKKDHRTEISLLNYSHTQFKSLDALISNISYVEKSSGDFIEETKAIKEIVEECISSNKVDEVLQRFFEYDVIRIYDKNFFNNLIAMFYELKRKYHNNLPLIRRLQDLLFIVARENFRKAKGMDAKLNTTSLYLREFLDIRYLDTFKETTEIRWLNDYNLLISNTINKIFGICDFILLLDMDQNIKKKYFSSQVEDFSKILEYYRNNTPYEQEDSEAENLKQEILNNQKEYLNKKKLELIYKILYSIEKEEISKSFFEIALNLYNLKEVNTKYYQFPEIESLDWINYNRLEGGAQTIPRFNFDTYRLLISFYKYQKDNSFDIANFEKENFLDNSFEDELSKLNEEFLDKYFPINKLKLSKFKKEILKEIKKKKDWISKEHQRHIIASLMKDEYINQFKEDCKKSWEKIQEQISEFVKIKMVEGGKDKEEIFQQYTTFPREWFLDSFHKTVGLSRHNGGDFGDAQGRSKLNKIIEEINNSFNKKKDKEIVLKDVISDLNKIIKKGKEYYLFYNSTLDIYKIPSLDYNRTRFETANLKLNDSVIHLCYANVPFNILIEENSFILKQYSQGFEDIQEQLVVKIEDLTDNDVKEIMKKNKKYENKDKVKERVKIRIAEKFELERTAGATITRLKV